MTELRTIFKRIENGWELCRLKDIKKGDIFTEFQNKVDFPVFRAWQATCNAFEDKFEGETVWSIKCEELEVQRSIHFPGVPALEEL